MSARDEWDAIVVGSGLGGLVCAAYLATGGRRVLVVEQHDVAGGNSHVFRRRRAYEFDVGVHYLGDCGPDGVLPAIFAGLGLKDRVTYREMDRTGFDRIVTPGVTMDMPAGWPQYRQRLKEALPGDAAGIDLFIDTCAALGEEMRSALLSADDLTITELVARTPTTVKWGRRNLSELFDHCGLSTQARTILAAQSPNYGMGPDQASVSMHATVTDHYVRGAYYPEGGGQVLAASLVEVLESHGGELLTKSKVERILVEDGKVTGVGLEGGRLLRSSLVVSNADYRRTVLDLVGEEHFPRRLVSKTRDATMGLPFATLYIALDTELPSRPNANLWWYRDDDIDGYYKRLADGDLDPVPFLFMSFASLKDPGSRNVCPPGHSNFQVMTLCPPSYDHWGVEEGPASGERYRRKSVYKERKAQLTEAMLSAAEEAIGPFRKHIVHLEAATPLTHERYTLSTGGTPFGLAEWGTGGSRPDTRTSVEGLYVVGANTRYGSGITGVAVGGIACAGQILERRLMNEVHTGSFVADSALLPERPEGWDPLAVSRGTARRGARGLARIR
ncbi:MULTISPECIES: phytoene desaturase family protein [unclassified Streptomyces]|uniref:phytoene desaturase family protein n=1 Tax=unclassified Streptomyces TaxID=2593676 RepID=UPI002E10FAAD|nr:NAD(P)/FAD-dependent oxidoreductase [Streptomyces sp. NBC_01207]WTA17676.1 NAD(P)/FAD-dependent oxidoreductase [Streptomyces sp. NBC_00853]